MVTKVTGADDRVNTLSQFFNSNYTTDEAIVVVVQLIVLILSLNNIGKYHRDLNPGNILVVWKSEPLNIPGLNYELHVDKDPRIDNTEKIPTVVLVDYSFSRDIFGKDGKMTHYYGFPLEILRLCTTFNNEIKTRHSEPYILRNIRTTFDSISDYLLSMIREKRDGNGNNTPYIIPPDAPGILSLDIENIRISKEEAMTINNEIVRWTETLYNTDGENRIYSINIIKGAQYGGVDNTYYYQKYLKYKRRYLDIKRKD